MDKAIVQTLPTAIRAGLMIGGAGTWLSQDDITAMAGAISTIIGVAWAMYVSYRKNKTINDAKGA